MRYLPQYWDEIVRQTKKAEQTLLFLDYDGTLTPIAAKPQMAQLSPQTREVLERISHHGFFKLAIISGRSLSETKALVGLENIVYAGNHGLEIECPPGQRQGQSSEAISFIHPAAMEFTPLLKRLEQRLNEELANIDGILIENKGLTLSIHYRLVKETDMGKVRKSFQGVTECGDMKDKLKVTDGKKVLEVRPPVEWNKGSAIEWLLDVYGRQGSLSIFAGDDVTDEDGFKVMRKVSGISIFVGEEKASTSANYYLNSPEELCCWLEKLAQSVEPFTSS